MFNNNICNFDKITVVQLSFLFYCILFYSIPFHSLPPIGRVNIGQVLGSSNVGDFVLSKTPQTEHNVLSVSQNAQIHLQAVLFGPS